MNYYVFQVSNQSNYAQERTAQEVFNLLAKGKHVWGFGQNTSNRKAIKPGDKVLFYLTGANNQTFVGAATLQTGAYEDTSEESKDWFLDPGTLRIDLEDVKIFDEPKPRKSFLSIEWRPSQGGSSKISERDYEVIMGILPDKLVEDTAAPDEMEFALEKYLEEFIVDNWKKIDFEEKLEIYVDDNGNPGQQYFTEDAGYIDILAKDQRGGFLVIELKKGRKNDEVVGQVLRYMGWVRKNLCKKDENVRGLIIVREKDIKLEYALSEIKDKVTIKRYNVDFKLKDY